MILHIVRNDVLNDSRVLRAARAGIHARSDGSVEVVGLASSRATGQFIAGNVSVRLVPLRTRGLPKDLASQLVKYAEWALRILKLYRGQELTHIHCHDLVPLPIAVALKRSTGAKLIYDAHELETEQAGQFGLRKGLAKWVESRLIRHVDALITVSPSIGQWYESRFPGVQAHIVRNVPKDWGLTLHGTSPTICAISWG